MLAVVLWDYQNCKEIVRHMSKNKNMYSLQIDGVICDCSVYQEKFTYYTTGAEVCIAIDDIICVERNKRRKDKNSKKWIAQIHYIKRCLGKAVLKKASIKISGQEEVCQALLSDLQGPFEKVDEKRPKKVLVLINPIGGKTTAKEDYKKTVQPLFELAGMSCDVIVSERAGHIPDIIATYDWCDTDAIVILGGDGSCSEVINAALKRVQTENGIDFNDQRSAFEKFPIPISIIPTGTGNAIAKGLLYYCDDITTAALYAIKGETCDYNVNGVYCDGKLVSYACLMVGYGFYGDLAYYSEIQRWMRRARYYLVSAWMIFFKPLRYFNAKMNLKLNSLVSSIEDVTSSETVETEETVDGRYLSVGIVPNNVVLGDESAKGQSALILFHNCRAIHLVRIMKASFSTYDLRGFPNQITLKSFSELNLNVTVQDENPINHIVNIDGEVYNVVKLEFMTRTFQGAIKLFGASATLTAHTPEKANKQGE